jgi:site-specific DNA recombinase
MQAKGQYLYFFCVGRQQKRTGCDLPYLPALDVEQAVEQYYRIIRIPQDVQETIRRGLRADLDQQRLRAAPEIAHARGRVTELEDERRRLARGVVTGAVPEDLAREEQERINRELSHAQRILATSEIVYIKIEDTLNRALALVGRCDEVYRLGGPQVRRMSNQFFFEQLLIDVEEDQPSVAGAIVREPWATLLAPGFQAQMAAHTTNPNRDLDGRGSKDESLVPPVGFEPTLSEV